MTEIILHTAINAPIQVVFDCARSIDIHMLSTAKTNEKAIAGRTTGLCELMMRLHGGRNILESTRFLAARSLSLKRLFIFKIA